MRMERKKLQCKTILRSDLLLSIVNSYNIKLIKVKKNVIVNNAQNKYQSL